MKDFFRHNGILILIAAILLALVTAVVSMLFGGVADPLSNLVGIVTTPVRNGITAVTNWAEEKYNDAFELEQMKEELAAMLGLAGREILWSLVFVFPVYALFLWVFRRVPKKTVL